MDDDHTKQALDDLADLFLTGIESDGRSTAPRRVAPKANPLDGPAPIRLRPKLTVHHDEPAPGPTPEKEMLDAVTGGPEPQQDSEAPYLRLADEDTPSPQQSEGSDRPAVSQNQPAMAMVEAVLLGNLPGVSGPWLQQYAQIIANQDGPVAVLHVGAERVEVELIESKDTAGQLRPVIEMGREGDRRPALVALLDSLVRAGEHAVTTVMVHVEPTVDGTESLRLFAIDDWTLLCGGDDASVVAAYRMLKQRAETDVTVSDKRVGLMIMGADQAQGQAAAQRIRSTADSFLNTPVELVGWQKQMIPVHVRQLGTFENVTQLWPRLCDWFATLEAPPVEHVEAPAPQPEPAPAPVVEAPKAKPRPRVQPARPVVMDIPAPQRRERPRPTPRREPEPAPEATPTPVAAAAPQSDPTPDTRHPTSEAAPTLASLIETLPGSVALEARCPKVPGAEIVLDQQGALHLLYKQAGDLERAITELLAARQWVEEHRRLLALTQRQLKLDEASATSLHLFTERAELATQLVARLGDQLKLHLIRQVAVGGTSTWVCAPLN